ncbi:MAG: ATP-dependent RecD-like DNA helicase [Thermodesulfobacteriota bacterium]|nr:ATP-dependent RecD-like DNA helicase [Thermodesulfobacteriota bacterium]
MTETLEGILEKIVYFSEDDNFTVARLKIGDRKNFATIVGNMSVSPGETLRLKGMWNQDKKYGEQFKVDTYLALVPATLNGIEKYLGSGLVKGVGPVMAGRLTDRFGLKTLEVIESEPSRLTEVEGIGEVRAERIKKAWDEQKAVREVMIFLQGYGANASYAARIYKEYGDRAQYMIKENPYRLADEISGIGFKTADKIAQKLGIDPASPLRAEAGIVYVLREMVKKGHVYYLFDELIEKASEILDINGDTLKDVLLFIQKENKVIIEGSGKKWNAVYLKPLYIGEENVARKLRAIIDTPAPRINIDIKRAIEWVHRENNISLAERQKMAIEKAITSKFLIITGGPGTGKTTIVKSIIKIMERMHRKIALASPTGRAAKRLSELTGKEARTIHRLLEFSPREKRFKRNQDCLLEVDLLIVDEASMIDLLLFNSVLKAMPLTSSFILVGDSDQLPSVGPGNVLKDIIDSQVADVVILNEIFRQARKSRIITNAHRINKGEFPETKNDSEEQLKDFYFIEKREPEEVLKSIKYLVSTGIPKTFGFRAKDDIQVLSPMHKGIIGVNNLNCELQNLLNPYGKEFFRNGRKFKVNDKVMQIENNYEKDIFNGDIGIITKIDEDRQEIRIRFEERELQYDYSEIDEVILAYAISIHKAQGSEYPAVIVPVHLQHYIMLQKNLLYTAITRGKKLVVLIGTKKAIAVAIKNNKVKERYTKLDERLKNVSSFNLITN